jgi:hypothetical protein
MRKLRFAVLFAASLSAPALAAEPQVINGKALFPEAPVMADGKLLSGPSLTSS